ncbi:DUF202 domain-containing protein [Nocardioides carbamazepini]|uniref:DUF202 domain-containing protein n=1 Tax=Nocardioides carbamazepini TaxID=2854259 RepID=UPI002149AB6F|nr:DUF202 domain-containing protein [Nocardioides carbamazepini]MCR1783239.1 DUF202 domain-containing protein [Nocardioides carbamazepini]
MSRAIGDPGEANERTALGWQRTSLSLVAGAAIMARLTVDALGLAAVLPLAAALILGLWVFAESRARYDHDAGTRDRARHRGGRAPLSLAIATALIAATELASLTLAHQRG